MCSSTFVPVSAGSLHYNYIKSKTVLISETSINTCKTDGTEYYWTGQAAISSSGTYSVQYDDYIRIRKVTGWKQHSISQEVDELSQLPENKILWSGVDLMASTTITLSEAISEQRHGIVLVFGWYSNSTVGDQWFSSHFVPKYYTSVHEGKGMSFFSCGSVATMSNMNKYLYISDTSIYGYQNNNATMTSGGITVTNGNYVLRYVLGV